MNDALAGQSGGLAGYRRSIAASCRLPEPECVLSLAGQARIPPAALEEVRALAASLVRTLRAERRRAPGVDALMQEFSLSTQEGVALMCLAEALLRIPDAPTRDELIREKLAQGDWRRHLGHSPSLFVNAAAWGLMIGGELVGAKDTAPLGAALTRLIARGGAPLIRRGMDAAMRLLGEQFVCGRTIHEALQHAARPDRRRYRYSFDMLGEAAMTDADARHYLAAYGQAIEAVGSACRGQGPIAGHGVSVKLSALHPRYCRAQRGRVMAELYPRLLGLLQLARARDIGINIDAEEADRLELSLDLLERLCSAPELAGWHGMGFVVQAYQKRAPAVVDYLVALARSSGHRLMVRLVKGAYWDTEIKRAQVEGQPDYAVFTRKAHTDVCYLACARKLLAARDRVYPQFATHNALTLATIHSLAGTVPKAFEFQCLHGMGESLYDQVAGPDRLGHACRIYAPVGSHETLLAYLVRRLLENGANTSFVNRLVDPSVAVEELLVDPVAQALGSQGAPHGRLPLPRAIFLPQRLNSNGVDFSDDAQTAALEAAVAESRRERPVATPLLAREGAPGGAPQPVSNPARRSDVVGTVWPASAAVVDRAVAAAAASLWPATAPAARAAVLERCADALEADRDALVALCVREAGKTLPNAVGEVREAADFCRYYAGQLREGIAAAGVPLGPVACISPWNFPLAIFVGQVSAALAAGNPVLAKPAEQTPLVAARALRLMRAAGVPADALQFLPGAGEVVGAALVAHPGVKGVVFTGSTEVAAHIQQRLAQRGGDVVLIAETGGQNAMIVDSTALPEQVVADALASAFDSAGQRCSCLRVLCLQDTVAERILAMLLGAAEELALGDPAQLCTDIGPVIDEDARAALEAYITQPPGRLLWRAQRPLHAGEGSFVAPAVIEIDSLHRLWREVFGPVLHVLRYPAGGLPALLEDINTTGYGLTLGVHSRLDGVHETVAAHARVGNIYVNRNMIGAVVGVQPFGGEGLSGTGPKAGGPLMLRRLMRRVPAPAPEGARDAERLAATGAALDALLQSLDQLPLDAARHTALERHAANYRARSYLPLRLALPGPVGERNTLAFAPRGRVAAVGGDLPGLLRQVAACLATGNEVLAADTPETRAWLAAAPPLLRERVRLAPDWLEQPFDAVLCDLDADAADALRCRLAERPGPLVPLLLPVPDYELERLLVERCVSVNTAATGGNAALMALGD